MKTMEDLFNDIKTYLPKYLSDESLKDLFSQLQAFPGNLDNRLYTNYFQNDNIIYQGDGLKGFLVTSLPNPKFIEAPIMVLSNTCDIDKENKRFFASNICYAPLFSLANYKQELIDEGIKNESSINNHVEDIKKQKITQILYLPKGGKLPEDCIVFLDRINHCNNSIMANDSVVERRIFMLSNYGFYLFLVKLSIHFSRVQERQDRRL